MRFNNFLCIANSAASVIATSLSQAATNAGYLAAIFKGDEPSVFFYKAPADQPMSFQALNNGQATLVPTTGTGGARDPYILKSYSTSETQQYRVLATDLDIAKTDWGQAQANGSRSIFVWESTDGVNWSKERLVELMPSTAGYVWAPSAIWDAQRSQYAVFWASQVYAANDPEHNGPATGPYIYYSHTSDFRTFSSPARWNPSDSRTVIDQEIQQVGTNSYIRYLKDTAAGPRVVLDRSDDGIFGTWNRIGVPVDQVREGPASFQDINNPQRYYLWEDNYGGSGYECYYTETFQTPYTPCSPALSPAGMRHGSVIQVSQTLYNALS
ncbi:glycoside hydrolase family 43 protein [Cercospora zeae-maydis SCOH1-5]|uniref:Glycoside hydrolase family 43 protein n=1 Tax=Cercospora zeae-maydis SCOH1-5 TaxID=717836 RepID=A0A6A6FVA3_9PEZI|nr:glycoside hydrolase family 43 protein [Cercospora zeae-maydis SCOH1-5]